MNKIQVIEVTDAPQIGDVEIMGAIRSKEAARSWAARNGYPTVYWLKKRERVYAQKSTRVDVAAKQIQQQSDHLLEQASS